MANTPAASEDPADLAVNEYLNRVDSGEDISQEAFIAGHPEVADALRSFFAGERLMQLLVGSACSGQKAPDTGIVSVVDTGQDSESSNSSRPSRKLWTTFPTSFGR